jgi:hypothetical protein
MRFHAPLATGVLLALCATAGLAQRPPQLPSGLIPSQQGGIIWFGTLRSGLAEARRTNRPILLVSAAPHCHNVSGIW